MNGEVGEQNAHWAQAIGVQYHDPFLARGDGYETVTQSDVKGWEFRYVCNEFRFVSIEFKNLQSA